MASNFLANLHGLTPDTPSRTVARILFSPYHRRAMESVGMTIRVPIRTIPNRLTLPSVNGQSFHPYITRVVKDDRPRFFLWSKENAEPPPSYVDLVSNRNLENALEAWWQKQTRYTPQPHWGIGGPRSARYDNGLPILEGVGEELGSSTPRLEPHDFEVNANGLRVRVDVQENGHAGEPGLMFSTTTAWTKAQLQHFGAWLTSKGHEADPTNNVQVSFASVDGTSGRYGLHIQDIWQERVPTGRDAWDETKKSDPSLLPILIRQIKNDAVF